MTRSLIREYIFKLLFRIEFIAPEDMPEQVKFFFDEELPGDEDDEAVKFPPVDEYYIRDKFDKICAVLPEIDAKIAQTSKGWSIERIGKVEISVLRLAVYEMLYDDDIPVGVAIDEAVELVKKYGQDASPTFVNGILASIAK